jgi:citrate lyase beta subunit
MRGIYKMRYDYSNELRDGTPRNNYMYSDNSLVILAEEWNKNSGKEVLQYVVGSLLYMPASNTKIVKKIISGEYSFVKAMVLDLEDSLGDDLVGFGQKTIQSTIHELAEAIENGTLTINDIPLIFVRVRESKHITDTYNMLGSDIQYITGFNIPKFDKTTCDDYIEKFTEIRDKVKNEYDTQLYIMPIIENKNTMYRQLRMDNLLHMNNSLRAISDSVLNIRVGGADFCSVYGIRRGMKDDIYDIGVVRSVLNDIMNVFGKNYIVSGPVWEYFENKDNKADTRWSDGLKKELYADRLNGFIGKTCIHPSQCMVIQESLIVDKSNYFDAMNILGMNENTTGVKKGANGNRMNEVKTHSNWARKTIALAKIYGVKED